MVSVVVDTWLIHHQQQIRYQYYQNVPVVYVEFRIFSQLVYLFILHVETFKGNKSFFRIIHQINLRGKNVILLRIVSSSLKASFNRRWTKLIISRVRDILLSELGIPTSIGPSNLVYISMHVEPFSSITIAHITLNNYSPLFFNHKSLLFLSFSLQVLEKHYGYFKVVFYYTASQYFISMFLRPRKWVHMH